VLLAAIFSCNSASKRRIGRESAKSKNNSAVFSRISVKKPSGKGKRGSNWGDQGVCFMEFPGMEENHGMDKKPLFTAFPHSATLCPYCGRFAFQSLLWGFLLKRFFAVFWRNNGILRFSLKLCAIIGKFLQPDKKISPKRANPGQNWAPFDVGYLMSSILIIVSNTTSYPQAIQSSLRPKSGHKTSFGISK